VERGKIVYLTFFGLKEKPFNLTPDTKFLYLSKNHQDALNHLVYGIREREWFMVLTGDIGTGKTTIVRALLERLNEDTSSALILDPLLEGDDLLRAILEDFGIDNPGGTRKELIGRLNQFLLGELRQGRNTILIIDEAQHLSDQALEEIRLLSNLETEKAKLLQIILVGQVELHRKLESSLLRPLNQRISIRYHLLPLSRGDTEKYIHHRLLAAGSNGHMSFSVGALNEIFKHSRGIPRLINLICDRTLLAGYTRQSNYLDKKLVKKGVGSLKKQGVPSTIASKGRKIFYLGVLALFLGYISLIGLQGESLYVRSWRFAHSVMGPIPVIERHPVVTPKGGIQSTPTSAHEAKSSPFTHLYGLHISSYRDNRRALQDVNQLRELGYQAFTLKEDIPGKGIWYRVMFGRFQTRGEAQAMLKEIKTLKGFSDVRIIRAK
jgi:general secretion pathway protein A